jgi:serine/threonine-protein kinase Chk1
MDSIKKAIPLDAQAPVFAVKLIHKGYAIKQGRISAKQIATEVSLHSHVGQHPNIIEWFATGEDPVWRWIAMEFAESGDLFDKIEADVGVAEDIAHLYFRQLVSGVSFIHSKGVAHRDLKPENILLSDSGNLKLADFGMATMFEYKGARKLSTTTCGSPPYIAPEVLACSRSDRTAGHASRYAPDQVDMWSCGVILFVLLAGNTPWDEPTQGSWEFQEYLRTNGRSTDALWGRVPSDALSLLRGMMSVDAHKRFTFAQIRQHPWYTRPNALLTDDGKVLDPLQLATRMLAGLRIDLTQQPQPSQQHSMPTAMEIDSSMPEQWPGKMSATQPETPINDVMFDWERPSNRFQGPSAVSSTQPVSRDESALSDSRPRLGYGALTSLADEPSMSQFAQTPGIPLSLTQHARRFRDIVPAHALTQFFSHMPPTLLVQMLRDALHQENVPLPAPPAAALPLPSSAAGGASDHVATLKVRTVDGRRQSLHGEITVDRFYLPENHQLLEVRFVKIKGDPLEWRRFFKRIALLCKDAIFSTDA